MRSITFLIFFSIVLIVYSSVNYYLFVRGLQVFSLSQPMKRWYVVIFWTVVSMFIVGNVLERTATSAFSEWIYRIGAFWLAFMLYLFIAMVLIDFVRIINHFFHFLPSFSPIMRFRLGLSVFSLVSLIVIGGYINALCIKVKEIPLTIHKKVSGSPEVKILMASDIHLGALIGESREKRLLDIIRNQKPDLVLLCGDLVDGEIAPVLRKNLGRHIQEIDTPYGVYAILGNHEYIGGIEKTLPYLKSINIRVLIDETLTLPNGIQLVGRNDRSGKNINGGLKSLDELLSGLDLDKPVIVMNHQPFNLDEVARANVDLHLSGHTHDGQLWPFNYMTEAIFELSWGLMKKGNTNFYVSSGFGSWGPPVRTGNRPEVVVFNLKFE
ncbi:MAG TPA: metallophosphoesterase [Prolixibacteraceae bacterium]|nr:metallophosphoesterase [Prolixibacteraceae bacterium]